MFCETRFFGIACMVLMVLRGKHQSMSSGGEVGWRCVSRDTSWVGHAERFQVLLTRRVIACRKLIGWSWGTVSSTFSQNAVRTNRELIGWSCGAVLSTFDPKAHALPHADWLLMRGHFEHMGPKGHSLPQAVRRAMRARFKHL